MMPFTATALFLHCCALCSKRPPATREGAERDDEAPADAADPETLRRGFFGGGVATLLRPPSESGPPNGLTRNPRPRRTPSTMPPPRPRLRASGNASPCRGPRSSGSAPP
eukprot:14655773-Alexandrium_andersonii.AAC.1